MDEFDAADGVRPRIEPEAGDESDIYRCDEQGNSED